jgi:hypothetical protein
MEYYLALTLGPMRFLSEHEKELIQLKIPDHNYKYVTTGLSKFENTKNDLTITIPTGFLTDGSSGPVPDWGRAWLFHDWLYAKHEFDNEVSCTRREADKIMANILHYDNFHFVHWLIFKIASWDIFKLWSRAWERSGSLGPQFLQEHLDN